MFNNIGEKDIMVLKMQTTIRKIEFIVETRYSVQGKGYVKEILYNCK